ncbi:MAG: tyrosine-type recombinase/integrase [Anaerolineales bacterium]|nr:tyrosine-type recombinase/integrase [Anaerolineales bacterium]
METTSREFLDYIKNTKGSSTNTILAYRSDLAQLNKVFSEELQRKASPADIRIETIRMYTEWLSEQGYRPATMARKIAAVRSYIDYLVRFDIIKDPGMDKILQTESTPRRKPRILTKDEIQRLLEAPREKKTPRNIRDSAILAVLFKTGLRAADLVGLQMSDLDREAGMILREEPETNLKLADAGAILEQYLMEGRPHLARNREENAVFLNQRGSQLSRQALWLIVKRWAKKAMLGNEVSPHTLRHTLAYSLLQEGVSRKVVQSILGLSSPNSIRVLSKLDEKEETE